VNPAYRTIVAFETTNNFVNICQNSSNGQFFYVGQERGSSTIKIQLLAVAAQGGYRATNGNTVYQVLNWDGGWTLTVTQNGQVILRERDVNAPPIASGNNPRPPVRPPTDPVRPPIDPIDPSADPRLTCAGGIHNRNMYFSVSYTKEGGFSSFELRDRTTQRLIQQGTVAYSEQNEQGQPIYRGAAGDANVVVVGLAQGYQTPGSEMSFSIDGQWGRGTCRS
jgi:hypothetical protein